MAVSKARIPRHLTLASSVSTDTAGAGTWYSAIGQPTLLRAWLTADGGTATVNVYGRGSTTPQRLLVTFALSGVSDEATPYYLDEPWEQYKAEVVSPAGGAVVSCEMSA